MEGMEVLERMEMMEVMEERMEGMTVRAKKEELLTSLQVSEGSSLALRFLVVHGGGEPGPEVEDVKLNGESLCDTVGECGGGRGV